MEPQFVIAPKRNDRNVSLASLQRVRADYFRNLDDKDVEDILNLEPWITKGMTIGYSSLGEQNIIPHNSNCEEYSPSRPILITPEIIIEPHRFGSKIASINFTSDLADEAHWNIEKAILMGQDIATRRNAPFYSLNATTRTEARFEENDRLTLALVFQPAITLYVDD